MLYEVITPSRPPMEEPSAKEIAGHVEQHDHAREQVRTLVGDIWLKPTPEGHLEATLTGRYEGLVKSYNFV